MALEALKARLSDIHNLHQATALLSWDQQTYMPPGGAAARGEQLATLSRMAHELLTADETGRLLQDAAHQLNGDSDSLASSLVRVAQRDYDHAVKIPSTWVAEQRRAASQAYAIWVEARAQNNFAHFLPMLQKMFDLARQKAEYLGYQDDIYDPLIDESEPGMTTAIVRQMFDELRAGQVPLVRAIVEKGDVVSDAVLHRAYPTDKQREFGEMVVRRFGFDFHRGRQDTTVHPFCISFSRDDVRLTTRFNPEFLSEALFGTLHESGHGMYEQGSAAALEGTILVGGTGLGIHESQSRLWENVVGRSRGFWQYFYPQLQAAFPDSLQDVDLETFYRAVNRVNPSFIRVEADELTYNMHIMLRFDLETAVLHDELAVKDLPAAWNAKMEEYLGITPPTDALGVLQDVHWSAGYVGYFPTYTLGNVLSAQFYEKAIAAHPNIPADIANGEFGDLFQWMTDNIYTHGRQYDPLEIIQRATGGGIQTAPYLAYLKNKFGAIYGI